MDFLRKREALAALAGADFDQDVGELAVTAGLFFEAPALGGLAANAFSISGAGAAGIDLDAVFARQAIERHAQMDFALTGKAEFARGRIWPERKRWVFVDELGHGGGEFDIVLAILGLNRHGIDRLVRGMEQSCFGGGAVDGDDVAANGFFEADKADDLIIFGLRGNTTDRSSQAPSGGISS
jgi:hypothetical protein